MACAVAGLPIAEKASRNSVAANQAGNSPEVALGRLATLVRIAHWYGASRGGTWLRCGRANASPVSRGRVRA
jgi:hypothetical protein